MARRRIRAEPLDGADATMLVAAFTDEIVERYPTWTPASGPSAHPTEFIPPDGLFVVAYRNEAPVGCGGFKRIEQQRAEIKRLYVGPDGRRDGLARRILEHLESRGPEAGFIAVRLDTGNQQPEALRAVSARPATARSTTTTWSLSRLLVREAALTAHPDEASSVAATA